MNKNILIWIIAIIMLVLTSMGALADLDKHLNLYSKLDNATAPHDNLGNFTLTNSGGTTTGLEGIIINGSYFDGINGEIDTNLGGIGDESVCFSVWVNASTQADEKTAIGTNGGYISLGNNYGAGIGTANKHNFAWHDGAYQNVASTGDIVTGTWTHLVGTWDGTNIYLYVDSVIQGGTSAGVSTPATVHIGSVNGGRYYNGNIDEVGIYMKNCTQTDVNELYNGGAGAVPPIANPVPPIITHDTLNISTPNPLTNTQYQTNNLDFNTTVNSTWDFICELNINDTLNTTNSYSAGVNVFVNSTIPIDDGHYNYTFTCYNATGYGDNNENTSESIFFIDAVDPIILTKFVSNRLYYLKNLTGQFNFTDNLMLHSFNISIDGSNIAGLWDLNTTFYSYNLSYNVSALIPGNHTLSIRIADGHTSKELLNPDSYDPTNGLFNDYIKYRFKAPYQYGEIKVQQKDGSLFDTWNTEQLIDRYKFTFKPYTKSDSYTFEVESDSYISIVHAPNSKYGSWLIYENHWLDFMPYTDVTYNRISDTKVEVTINNVGGINEFEFNSIGDLNVVTQEFPFYRLNMTASYEDPIFSGYSTTYTLDVDFGELLFNISGLTPDTKIQIDNANFTGTLNNFNINNASFTYTNISKEINNYNLIYHNWFFNLSNVTAGYLGMDQSNQSLFNITIGACVDNQTYEIANFSYFDELNDAPLNATNSYDLIISDGTKYYNQTGSFVEHFSDLLCTNVNPDNVTYNWDMWGQITSLSSPGYVGRVININEIVPYTLSNNPRTYIPLYLIGVANSSTVKYNWFTENFQVIDGTMRIFRCDVNGSKNLVESLPIISSLATANIQLLTQAYSYDVIIDGIIYTDPVGYSACHIESITELTYYVDTSLIDIGTLIGLNAVACKINKTSNATALMIWGENPENTDDDVMGCIVGSRRSINGLVEVFSNCTIEADYRREVGVPINGNEYIVQGYLKQNNEIAVCGEVSFRPEDEAAGRFGVTGLLATFFLFIGLVLIYAGKGEEQLLGGGIGIVIAWFLGILNFSWLIVSAIVVFLIIIALIGRYTRKQP